MSPKESHRFRKATRKIEKWRLDQIKKEVKTSFKAKKGLNQSSIDFILSGCPNFLGSFAQNQLKFLKLTHFPIFLIVNTDNSNGEGEHWIMLYLTKSNIEVFCSLGFNLFNFNRIPCDILTFLNTHSRMKKIRIFRKIQSDSSFLCGYFCVLFVLIRPYYSFRKLYSIFSTVAKSRHFLLKFFKYCFNLNLF